MLQAKFSIDETQARFLSAYKAYGFKDKSAMVRGAINHLKKQLDFESLKRSADLYSEVYAKDEDLKDLAETALDGWPE
jgi:hypothetical protein